jgi:hypothetical protein
MIAGAAFDLDAGQFSAGEAASILKMKASVLAMQVQRGLSPPTRREGAAGSGRKKKRSRQGKALFSLRDMVKIRCQQILSEMSFSLGESVHVGDGIKLTPKEVAARLSSMEAQDIAETLATKGEWMWAMARSIERGTPFYIYGYATRREGEWPFDMHVENPGTEKPSEPPCFGCRLPHIYVPVGEIFIAVYNDCKKLLGISMESANSKGV